MLLKIDGFRALKIRFLENHWGQTSRNAKRRPKWVFSENPATWISRVIGDHWAFCPFGLRFLAVFWFFPLFSSLTFFLAFLHIFWHDLPVQNLMRSHVDRMAKFWIFRESWKLCQAKLPICRQRPKLGQTIWKWPKIWGEASWAINKTNHRLSFKFWS